MNIEKLQNEVDDFCSFAEEYSTKMNEILSGKLTEKDLDNYLNNVDNDNDDKSVKNTDKNVNDNENPKLKVNPQKELKNIELNTVKKEIPKNEQEPSKEKEKENKDSNIKTSSNKNINSNKKETVIDYSKWEHFDDNEEDNEEDKTNINNNNNNNNNNTKKPEKKLKWKERVLNEIESHREKGNNYYKKYKFEEAINEYTLAINTAKSPDQTLVFGTSEFNFMPYKSSFYALPVDFALYNNRALCNIRLKKYKEAIDDCTEALNIQSDSQKALWRRSSSYQELKNYEMALKDLYRLKELIEQEEKNKVNTKENNLISLKSIEERIELYENEYKQYQEDEKILNDIKSTNKDPNDIPLDFWINRTLKTILSSKLVKTNKNMENNLNATFESKNCKMAVLTLINSFRIYPEMTDIFRATNSFKRFTSDTVLCIETFNNIVSILVEACLNSEKNTNELSKYIPSIIEVIINEFKKSKIPIDNKSLTKKIPSSLKFSHFCSFIHLFSVGFRNKIFFEKAVYNILNPDNLSYLSTFLQFYIKKSIEYIKKDKSGEKLSENKNNNKDINEVKNKNYKLNKLYQNCAKYIINWVYNILHNENNVDGNYLLERIGIKLNLIKDLYAECIFHHWIDKQTDNNGAETSKKFYNNVIMDSLLEIFNYQINQTKKLNESKKNSYSKEKQNIFIYEASQYLQFLNNIKFTIFYAIREYHNENNKNSQYALLYNKNTLLPCFHNYLLLANNYNVSITENQFKEYKILDNLIDDLSNSEKEDPFNFNLQYYDTINLILIKLYRILPSFVELQLKKNWNEKLSLFFKALFSNIMKSPMTNDTKTNNKENNTNNDAKFTNLLYFLKNIHYIDTFLQLLFICLKKDKTDMDSISSHYSSNIISDWDSKYNGYTIFKFIFLNIKTLWKYNNQKDSSSKIHEIKSDAEEENLKIIKKNLSLNTVQQNKDSFSKVIGNAALCISECAEDVNECNKLEKYNIIDDILYFLRELTNIQAQTNLAISCSRLIKSEKIQEEFRKKGGFTLLHNLGPKILAKQ